jgi:2-oxoacid:acceptor oxidoreductase gamma subunit (pyruvate/2-ketoisovalerate family)
VHEGIVIGGLGGQGVLFIGRLLAEAAMLESREVVWLPSYGAEKRGGNVWCHVTISDEGIGELFVTHPTVAVAVNAASLAKLEPMLETGGLLVINRSLAIEKTKRENMRVVGVPATDLALELGDDSVANLVILGALVAAQPVVTIGDLNTAMDSLLGKSPRLEMNRKALHRGFAFVREAVVEKGIARDE